MALKIWTDISQWIDEENRIIAAGYDSVTVFTGEEGTGKSYAMLAKNVMSDPSFYKPGAWSPGWRPDLETDRVLFDEGDFKVQALKVAALGPGRAIQLDEVDAHRRGANTSKRRDFLKFLKERRALRLKASLGYPHIDQVDRDVLRSRVRYRAHQPMRGLLEVRQRTVVRETTDRRGDPGKVVAWPVRGRFPVPDISGFKIVRDYDSKKAAFTMREDDLEVLEADFEPRQLDIEAALPVVARIKERLVA